jgi:hypothetical protein
MTNSELYERAIGLLNDHRESTRSLRDWLTALAGILAELSARSDLDPEVFLDALARAFTTGVAPLDGVDRYDGWEASTATEVLGLLARQVDDLDAMEHAGTLEGEWIYLGTTAPSGEQWFNFGPLGFIECGIEGAFHGWAPHAQSPRKPVDGDVAVVAPDGEITAVSATESSRPIRDVETLSWADVGRFVLMGQIYE